MRKTIIFSIISLVITIIIVSGCIGTYKGDVPEPLYQDPADCEELSDEEKDRCYSYLGSKNKDLNLCKKISKPGWWRGECFSDVGIALNKLSICMEIESEYHQERCLAKVGVSLADVNVCNYIEGQLARESCYAGIISVTKNKSLCKNITLNEDLLKLHC